MEHHEAQNFKQVEVRSTKFFKLHMVP